MRPTISLVMIVKNEAFFLQRCLESAAKYVDEIVIVDTGSTDHTKEIALAFNAAVYDFHWNNDFSAARNFALDRSTSDWNLIMDADEFISNNCAEAIRDFIETREAIGKIKRVDKFNGPDGINYEQIYISRLFPSSCRYSGKIHEQIVSDLPRVIIDVEVQHDGYFQQNKNERNIPILLEVIEENPIDPYFHFQIAKEYRGLERHEKALDHLKIAYANMTHHESYAPSIIVNLLYAIIATGKLGEGIQIIDRELEFLNEYPDFFFVSALYLLELISSDPEQYGGLVSLIEKYYKKALEIGDNGREGSVLGTGSYAALHNLGVFYEVTGRMVEAKDCYAKSAEMNYSPSIERLAGMQL